MRAPGWLWISVVGLAAGACFDGRFMLHQACRSDAECVELRCIDGFCGGPGPGATDTDTGPDTGAPAGCGDGVVGPEEQCDGEVDDPATRCVACEIATCPPGYHLVDATFCSEGEVDPDACLATCVPDTCGNGLLDTYEECDDGNADNGDACLVTCAGASCGDGFVFAGAELCDDGNKANGDACDQRCTVPSCGDGDRDDGEECDDGNIVDGDACRNVCVAARCGDGVVQAGVEECDDGADGADDSCDDACKAATCGDGAVQGGEACDDGNQLSTDECVEGCALASCGDGFVQDGVELCDEGAANGQGACDVDCLLVSCGDGVVQAGEECDDGDLDNTDECLEICYSAFCGDGFVRDGVETCDLGPYNPAIGCVDDCSRLTPIVALAAGPFTTCALVDGGPMHCWGRNSECQLGVGNTAPVGDDEHPGLAPAVELPRPATQVVLGRDHTCALLDDSSVICWGGGGLLGYGDGQPRGCDPSTVPANLSPVQIWEGDESTLELAAGETHTCARSSAGRVRCWGVSGYGALGNPDADLIGLFERPVDMPAVDIGGEVAVLRANNHNNCAVLTDGRLRCWGSNFLGSLGYGNYAAVGDDETPASVGDVPVDGAVVEVAVGPLHVCARLADDRLQCWGLNANGELGLGPSNPFGYTTPQEVPIGAQVVELRLGASLTCARMAGGDLRCWGAGAEGQLANGTGESFGLLQSAASAPPIDFGAELATTLLAVGNGHVCAGLEYGGVHCWGAGADGQTGYAQTANLGDEPDEVPVSRPVGLFPL